MHNPSYTTQRNDILSILPNNIQKVLDVGCSNGAFGHAIKEKYPHAIVWGIEYDELLGKDAVAKLDKVIIDNAETLFKENKISESFDCIIFADVLEHLINPWEVVKKAKDMLSPNGIIVASLPNIRYYKAFCEIFIRGKWPYEDRGLFDKTHLRFFTKRNIYEMFDSAGLEIVTLKRNFRFVDRKSFLNKGSNFLNIPLLREFFTFQYIVVAK